MYKHLMGAVSGIVIGCALLAIMHPVAVIVTVVTALAAHLTMMTD